MSDPQTGAHPMIGYKVVRDLYGRWVSVCAPYRGCVGYSIGLETRPIAGPLAVFDSVENAFAFIVELTWGGDRFDLAVFECEYTPVVPTDDPDSNALWVGALWVGGPPHTWFLPLDKCPSGTRLASSVTLLKKAT
jgi:hypothetical protein